MAPDQAATVDRLLLLMQRRLELAQDVARDKWNRAAPVEDTAREQAVVEAAVAQAAQSGVDPQRVRRFFRGQIEAGKAIQSALLAQWRAEHRGKFTGVPDLAVAIRPELDRLTVALVPALDAVIPLLEQPGANRLLQQRAAAIRIDTAGFDAAWQTALESVQAAPSAPPTPSPYFSASGLPK
jgi:chorismate mutase